jgi:hypothetical protein
MALDSRPTLDELARDIEIAAGTIVPILISGAPERTLATARLIVSEAAGRNPAGRGLSILIPEVHTLDAPDQEALLKLLATPGRPVRVIATTSIDLYERIMVGEFDRALFYRLNTIHIMLPFIPAKSRA